MRLRITNDIIVVAGITLGVLGAKLGGAPFSWWWLGIPLLAFVFCSAFILLVIWYILGPNQYDRRDNA